MSILSKCGKKELFTFLEKVVNKQSFICINYYLIYFATQLDKPTFFCINLYVASILLQCGNKQTLSQSSKHLNVFLSHLLCITTFNTTSKPRLLARSLTVCQCSERVGTRQFIYLPQNTKTTLSCTTRDLFYLVYFT